MKLMYVRLVIDDHINQKIALIWNVYMIVMGIFFPFVRTHYTVKEFEERENHWQNIMTQIRNLAYVKGYKDGARQFVEV